MKTQTLSAIYKLAVLLTICTIVLSCANIAQTTPDTKETATTTLTKNTSDSKGTLAISVGSLLCRTILPTGGIDLQTDVNKYTLSGTYTGSDNAGFTFADISWSTTTVNGVTTTAYAAMTSEATAKTILCDSGSWSFTLNAYDTNGAALLTKTISATISPGSNTLAFGTMKEATQGAADGNIDVSVTYPLTARVSSVSGALYTKPNATEAIDGTEKKLSPTAGSTTYSAEYINSTPIDSGWYFLRFTFYRYENGASSGSEEVMNTYTYSIHIAPGLTSSATCEITDFNTLYTITFDLAEGSWNSSFTSYPISFNASQAITLPVQSNLHKKGYVFSGWKNASGTSLTKIEVGTTADQTLTAQWSVAPIADTATKSIYGNGQALLVVSSGTGTTVYYDADNDGAVDSNELTLAQLDPDDYPANSADLSAYAVYGGSPSSTVSSTKITLTGGTIAALYGAGYSQTVSGNTNITMNGGTVTGSVYGGGSTGSVGGSSSITISAGTITGNVIGSGANSTASVNGTATVTITGGKFQAQSTEAD